MNIDGGHRFTSTYGCLDYYYLLLFIIIIIYIYNKYIQIYIYIYYPESGFVQQWEGSGAPLYCHVTKSHGKGPGSDLQ